MSTNFQIRNFFLSLILVLSLCSYSTYAQDLKWVTDLGSNSLIGVRAIDVDDKGNLYTLGSFEGTQDFDPSSATLNLTANGFTDVFIQKTDSLGQIIWVKNLGETNSSISSLSCFDIKVENNGSFYLVGLYRDSLDFDPSVNRFVLFAEGGSDGFIAKYDSAGNFIWVNGFYGMGNSMVQHLEIDRSGNLNVSGMFSNGLNYGSVNNLDSIGSSNRNDVFVAKIDTQGNWIWGKGFGGNGFSSNASLTVDNSNNVYIGGSFNNAVDFDPSAAVFSKTAKGLYDIFINKLDSNGNFVWVKTLESSASTENTAIISDGNSAIYVSGYFSDTLDLNPGPAKYPLFSTGNFDAFILKLNLQGDFIWAKSFYGIDGSYANRIALNNINEVLISGDFFGTVDFDPDSATTFNVSSQGTLDIFFLKLTPNGSFVSATSIGGSDYESLNDMVINFKNDLVYTGIYASNFLDFDPGQGVTTVSSNGQSNIFTLALIDSPLSVGIESSIGANIDEYTIYPNPSSGKFIIKNQSQEKVSIEVYAATGKLIESRMLLNGNDMSLDLRAYPKGIYLYRLVKSNGEMESGKLILD